MTSVVQTMSRAPAAVLWDMDGTLVDTEPYWIECEYALVEAHGGTLRVSDREGGGARFVVSLPAPYRNGRAA